MRVAITGGTGSLGSALIARLVDDGADRIVTMSRDEHKRLAMQSRYRDAPAVKVYAGNVRDEDRMVDVFAGCETVIHAAARKVVSGHHDEPREMLLTNVVGTANVLAAARRAGVRRVLFISSDKAVHANNPQPYGVSKAMAETLVIAENARSYASGMRSSILRYGNVLASNGSVVRVWRQRVAAGLPLLLSDERMTRFWLTLDDAVDYVLLAERHMRGGEVFVPVLRAAPVKDLLEAVAPGARYTVTGIRPGGEKLHEQLLSEDEARRARQWKEWILVPPTDTDDLWDRRPWPGEPLDEGVLYRSDVWPMRLSVDGLREMIGGER